MSLLLSINVESVGAVLESARHTLVDDNLSAFSQVGRAIGAIGALLYIAYRVWGHLARAEPIDVFPLLRPFALGLVIINFGLFTGFLDSMVNIVNNQANILVETTTDTLLEKELEHKKVLNERMNEIVKEGEEEQDGWWDSLKADVKNIYDQISHLGSTFSAMLGSLMRDMTQWCMRFATIAIDVVSTFFLVILTLLGPIVFGIACFDGFGHMLTNWISRYISISLWVPISRILYFLLTQVEISLINSDIASYQATTIESSTWIFTVFYLIGIVAYFTVPTIAGWVVDAGSGAGALLSKTVGVAMLPVNMAGAAAGAAIGGATGAVVAGKMTSGVTKVAKGDDAPQG